ncbi:hypothetical protein [Tautonia marina]|uniref:hypothetical protein n=1 Tax=Tautonia marina TaxID=2653855 RepID=UPI001260DBFC|nr:hypothetical protein [Tautonia marina]
MIYPVRSFHAGLFLISGLMLAGCGGNEPAVAPLDPSTTAAPPGTAPPPPPPMMGAQAPGAASAPMAPAPSQGIAQEMMPGEELQPGFPASPSPAPDMPVPDDLPGDDPKEVARLFLGTEDEATKQALMTEKARRAQQEHNITLQPDPNSPFEIGEATTDGDSAEVAIRVEGPTGRLEGGSLRLRREDGEWRAHAMVVAATAEHPEMTMDFENPMAIFGELGAMFSELEDAMEGFDPFAEGEDDAAADAARAAATFEAIEAVDLEAFRQSFTVDLALDGRPAGAVIAELAAPIGLELDRSKAPAEALDQPVTLTAEGLTRLEAIERVCEAVGLSATYGSDPAEGFLGSFEGDAVTPVAGPRPWPVAFAGPFLIEVTGVEQQPSGTGTLGLRVLGVGLPPAITAMMAADPFHEPIAIRSISGPGNQELLPDDRFPVTLGASELPEGVVDVTLDVPLVGLLRSVSAITEVVGQVEIPVPTEIVRMSFDPIEPGAVREEEGLRVSLRGEMPHQATLELERLDESDPDMKWHRYVFLLGRDRGGDPVEMEIGGGGGDEKEYSAFLSIRGEPVAMDLKFAKEVEPLVTDVRLEQIPLKEFGRMPEAIAALEFAGEEAPVSAELVAFLEKEQEQQPSPFRNSGPAYTLRIVNHANKDVRRLVLEVTFFDASGKAVGHAPPLNFTYEPHLVQQQDEREMTQSGFFVPEQAASATFRAREVGFTDGTVWKAEEE